MLNILLILHCRILGRLVLIPFLGGRRSPKGTDTQQQAEANHISVLENASKAVGCLIGINEQINHLCYGRMKQLVSYLTKTTLGSLIDVLKIMPYLPFLTLPQSG